MTRALYTTRAAASARQADAGRWSSLPRPPAATAQQSQPQFGSYQQRTAGSFRAAAAPAAGAELALFLNSPLGIALVIAFAVIVAALALQRGVADAGRSLGCGVAVAGCSLGCGVADAGRSLERGVSDAGRSLERGLNGVAAPGHAGVRVVAALGVFNRVWPWRGGARA